MEKKNLILKPDKRGFMYPIFQFYRAIYEVVGSTFDNLVSKVALIIAGYVFATRNFLQTTLVPEEMNVLRDFLDISVTIFVLFLLVLLLFREVKRYQEKEGEYKNEYKVTVHEVAQVVAKSNEVIEKSANATKKNTVVLEKMVNQLTRLEKAVEE